MSTTIVNHHCSTCFDQHILKPLKEARIKLLSELSSLDIQLSNREKQFHHIPAAANHILHQCDCGYKALSYAELSTHIDKNSSKSQAHQSIKTIKRTIVRKQVVSFDVLIGF